MVDSFNHKEISEAVASRFEWLLVNEAGRTFPLNNTEIEIETGRGSVRFGYTDDTGFHLRRIEQFRKNESELHFDVKGARQTNFETLRLIPRTAAAELSLEVELARLRKANETAALVEAAIPGQKLVRVSLDKQRGRIAKIILKAKSGSQAIVIADVTGTMTHESLTSSALLQLERLRDRKKDPVNEISIAAAKTSARNLRKLHALLMPRCGLSVMELTDKKGETSARYLPPLHLTDLWRERPSKLNIPSELVLSRTAAELVSLAPEKIDVVFSKQGETVRFLGLPFARVRKVFDRERGWFGVGRKQTILTRENFSGVAELIDELETYRTANSDVKKHEYYKSLSEAWLGSILRRDISLLDANLILSPLYNQFRTSRDKIDLLAIRRDGRLVIIELKTSPDRDLIFQAADYWRKIELQRRRGELAKARLFGDREIIDKPALIYTVAPALCFHRDEPFFAKKLIPEIEIWRFDLHENWRKKIKVIQRRQF